MNRRGFYVSSTPSFFWPPWASSYFTLPVILQSWILSAAPWLVPTASLHTSSSSASFINGTCLLASSSVCHEAAQILWRSRAKFTLALLFFFSSLSLSLSRWFLIFIFYFFGCHYFQKVCSSMRWKTNSQLGAFQACLFFFYTPFQTSTSSSKASI